MKVKKTYDPESKTYIQSITNSLKDICSNLLENKYCDAEANVIDMKENMYKLINNLGWIERYKFLVLLWDVFPIVYAILAMIVSFTSIIYRGSFVILGVPLWASFIAVIGTSVQILIGIVNDYKDDCMVTEYKRLWYVVLPFVGFVFGFIAFLLVTAGLINITSGQIMYNQSVNVTAISGLSNNSINGFLVSPPSLVIIICFLQVMLLIGLWDCCVSTLVKIKFSLDATVGSVKKTHKKDAIGYEQIKE